MAIWFSCESEKKRGNEEVRKAFNTAKKEGIGYINLYYSPVREAFRRLTREIVWPLVQYYEDVYIIQTNERGEHIIRYLCDILQLKSSLR